MHREEENPIRSLVVAVEKKHPRPRTKNKSSRRPPSPQFRTRKRKRFENPQRPDDPAPGISGETKPRDSLVHVPLRPRTDDYLRHSGQLVERSAFPARSLRESLLGALPGTWNGVEDLRDPSGIRISIVQCS